MLIATTEVRWIFPGTPPPEVLGWFRRGALWVQQPARVDTYLVLPGCADAGVKMREGRLEVKALAGGHEVVEYPGGVSGYRGSWVKWSREASGGEREAAASTTPGEEWVEVSKQRALRGFALDGIDGAPAPFEVDTRSERPAAGACVELTQILVEASAWWTLALEGFSADGDTGASLDRVAQHLFFAELPPLSLEPATSASYASWLASGRWRT